MSKSTLMVLAVIVALLTGWLVITLAVQQKADQPVEETSETEMDVSRTPTEVSNPGTVEISVEVYDPAQTGDLTLTVTE